MEDFDTILTLCDKFCITIDILEELMTDFDAISIENIKHINLDTNIIYLDNGEIIDLNREI